MKFYSAQTNAFYAGEFRKSYEAAGNWPDDAVEVDAATYAEFSGQPPAGKRRAAGSNGLPVWEDIPPRPENERRSEAKAEIDRKAGEVRARFLSDGDLIEQEYREAERAAITFREAGYPSDAVPQEVQSWADVADMTAQQASDDIESRAGQMRPVLATVRDLRLKGKDAMDKADADSIDATHQAYIDQLDAIKPTE